jgi:hypothetical protein
VHLKLNGFSDHSIHVLGFGEQELCDDIVYSYPVFFGLIYCAVATGTMPVCVNLSGLGVG